MPTMEIPRDEWSRFLDGFASRRAGAIVIVEVTGAAIGDQEAAAGLPLVGLSADTKDGESFVEVILGGRPEAHVTRIMRARRLMVVEEPGRPGLDAVAIDSEDGTTTLLRFAQIDAERQIEDTTT